MTAKKKRPARKATPPQRPDDGFACKAALAAGITYIVLCVAMMLRHHAEEGGGLVGAVCGDGSCAGQAFLSVRLEAYGLALMAAVVVARWIHHLKPARRIAAVAGMLALLHGGASLAFAASQWFGFAPVCVLCQIATVLSLIVAAASLGILGKAFSLPVLSAAPAALVGILTVLAVWPHLGKVRDAEHAGEHTAPAPKPVTTAAPTLPPPIRKADPRPTPTPVPTPSVTTGPPLGELIDAATVGNPNAPYELVMISDFSCPICKRFEDKTLPVLMDQAVTSGTLRIRFLFNSHKKDDDVAHRQLVSTTALSMAGYPLVDAIRTIRDKHLVSTPQGIALVKDEDIRAKARAALQSALMVPGWDAVVDQHEKLAGLLRDRYFKGDRATPLFLLFPGHFDPHNLPEPDRMYIFRGYQKADPFLKFMGIEPKKETEEAAQ